MVIATQSVKPEGTMPSLACAYIPGVSNTTSIALVTPHIAAIGTSGPPGVLLARFGAGGSATRCTALENFHEVLGPDAHGSPISYLQTFSCLFLAAPPPRPADAPRAGGAEKILAAVFSSQPKTLFFLNARKDGAALEVIGSETMPGEITAVTFAGPLTAVTAYVHGSATVELSRLPAVPPVAERRSRLRMRVRRHNMATQTQVTMNSLVVAGDSILGTSRCGKLVQLSLTENAILRWVDLKTGPGGVVALAYSPELQAVAVACSQAIVRMFSAATLEYYCTFPRPPPREVVAQRLSTGTARAPKQGAFPNTAALQFAWHAAPTLLAVYSDSTAYLWGGIDRTDKAAPVKFSKSLSAHGGTVVAALPFPRPDGAKDPEGTFRVATVSSDGCVGAWLLESARPAVARTPELRALSLNPRMLQRPRIRPAPFTCACALPALNLLVVGDSCGAVTVYNLAGSDPLPHPQPRLSVAAGPIARISAVAATSDEAPELETDTPLSAVVAALLVSGDTVLVGFSSEAGELFRLPLAVGPLRRGHVGAGEKARVAAADVKVASSGHTLILVGEDFSLHRAFVELGLTAGPPTTVFPDLLVETEPALRERQRAFWATPAGHDFRQLLLRRWSASLAQTPALETAVEASLDSFIAEPSFQFVALEVDFSQNLAVLFAASGPLLHIVVVSLQTASVARHFVHAGFTSRPTAAALSPESTVVAATDALGETHLLDFFSGRRLGCAQGLPADPALENWRPPWIAPHFGAFEAARAQVSLGMLAFETPALGAGAPVFLSASGSVFAATEIPVRAAAQARGRYRELWEGVFHSACDDAPEEPEDVPPSPPAEEAAFVRPARPESPRTPSEPSASEELAPLLSGGRSSSAEDVAPGSGGALSGSPGPVVGQLLSDILKLKVPSRPPAFPEPPQPRASPDVPEEDLPGHRGKPDGGHGVAEVRPAARRANSSAWAQSEDSGRGGAKAGAPLTVSSLGAEDHGLSTDTSASEDAGEVASEAETDETSSLTVENSLEFRDQVSTSVVVPEPAHPATSTGTAEAVTPPATAPKNAPPELSEEVQAVAPDKPRSDSEPSAPPDDANEEAPSEAPSEASSETSSETPSTAPSEVPSGAPSEAPAQSEGTPDPSEASPQAQQTPRSLAVQTLTATPSSALDPAIFEISSSSGDAETGASAAEAADAAERPPAATLDSLQVTVMSDISQAERSVARIVESCELLNRTLDAGQPQSLETISALFPQLNTLYASLGRAIALSSSSIAMASTMTRGNHPPPTQLPAPPRTPQLPPSGGLLDTYADILAEKVAQRLGITKPNFEG
eukprot:gnl/Chilomastix_cuspidata/1853.p1 GENE.gnl/Chilomastix_cuspidata/1853~~gnl/Chilomastix_cuspidata/1853.p1  ORF type:complete len:1375 (+),score=450.37 gnl/Chilomastix_cuspidata/1853:177-4127(+)